MLVPLTPQNLVALSVIAPFVAAALGPLLQRLLGARAGWLLALVPAAMFAALLGLLPGIADGQVVVARLGWVPTLGLDLVLLVDGLSLTSGY